MNIALLELLRRPRRFAAVGTAMTLLTVLLVALGGFLDGLELSQTGAYRAHDDMVLIFDDDADRKIDRSAITDEQADDVAASPAVAAIGPLEQTFTVASIDGELQEIRLFGYDLATATLPEPPPTGQVIVDAQLTRLVDLSVGDTIELGPNGVPVTVAMVIDDLTQGAPTVWTSSSDWRHVVGEANPTALPAAGTRHVLVARPTGGVDATTAALVTVAGVEAVTASEAVAALDVVQQQSSTFEGIILVTFVISLMVVALFFALITLERVRLYAMLKALGARTGELVRGVALQAVAVSLVALLVGVVLSLGLVALLPPDLPVRLQAFRLVQIGIGTVVVAVLGSLFTVRRLLRIDPAAVIG